MCRRVTCSSCGQPGYAGCGLHIEQVLGDVPVGQRCSCREDGRAVSGFASLGKWFKGLFSR